MDGIPKKRRARAFEEEIKNFLQKLDFKDIEGATDTFRINGNQVDACGGHENTLLVIECTMKQQLGKKSLRDKIKQFRGVIPLLERGFKKHPVYKKYTDIRYILATKNITVRKEDILYANEKPRIYIWDDNFIAYYNKLYDLIKEYAKYNLLGEIGVRPVQRNRISIPAFLTTFGKVRMYTFFMNPKDLLEIAYVARRETKKERFYQRIIKADRLKKIAEYIDNGNVLPNNIIIAFAPHIRRNIEFHCIKDGRSPSVTDWPFLNISYGILEFPRDYRSCWIIDGQHRLYAFIRSKRSFNMPILAFENLDVETQCKYFLDINKNQKPVPPDLVWDLNGDMIPSEEDGVISNTVKILNVTDPLYHKIYIPSSGIKKRKDLLKISGICISIKRAGLARETTRSKTINPFYDKNPAKTAERLSNALSEYFKCISEVFGEDWKLKNKGFVLDDGGNSVMIKLFEKIVHSVILKGKKHPTREDYIKYLSPLKDIIEKEYKDLDYLKKIKKSIASEGGKEELLKEFILRIRSVTGENTFGGKIGIDVKKDLIEIERKLKELIRIKLSEEDEAEWFKKKVPKDIYSRALKRMKNSGESDIRKIYLHITLGECMAIMRLYKTIFYPVFTKGEYGFGSDTAFEGALSEVIRIRNIHETHSVDIPKKMYDDKLLEIYLKKLEKSIESAVS